ncbi:hypothetical protein JCM33374_g2117 [Metschnikowia sp. JCM 33374]|nr:hypothetical protein JCM33374_g2117 [Metschnikowia sp. JCM 33374]
MSGIALKFTSLLLRTIAKPISVTLKAQAKEHESFRKACIKVAQTVHSTDIKLRMKLLGENKIKIRPLNDKKAIESGANFLSEFFIFSVAGSLILYESNRSRIKSNTEKINTKNDISDLQDDIKEVKILVDKLTADLELLHSISMEMARKNEATKLPEAPPTPVNTPATPASSTSETSNSPASIA